MGGKREIHHPELPENSIKRLGDQLEEDHYVSRRIRGKQAAANARVVKKLERTYRGLGCEVNAFLQALPRCNEAVLGLRDRLGHRRGHRQAGAAEQMGDGRPQILQHGLDADEAHQCVEEEQHIDGGIGCLRPVL